MGVSDGSEPPPQSPDIRMLYAQLVCEPFHLTIDQIMRMTDRQIYDIYFYPRDESGRLKPSYSVPDEFIDDEHKKSVFFSMCKAFGMPLETVQKKWDERGSKNETG